MYAATHTSAWLLNKLADILHKIETVLDELSYAHETNSSQCPKLEATTF